MENLNAAMALTVEGRKYGGTKKKGGGGCHRMAADYASEACATCSLQALTFLKEWDDVRIFYGMSLIDGFSLKIVTHESATECRPMRVRLCALCAQARLLCLTKVDTRPNIQVHCF